MFYLCFELSALNFELFRFIQVRIRNEKDYLYLYYVYRVYCPFLESGFCN